MSGWMSPKKATQMHNHGSGRTSAASERKCFDPREQQSTQSDSDRASGEDNQAAARVDD